MLDDAFGLAVSDRSIWRTVDGGASWDERQDITSSLPSTAGPLASALAQFSDIGIADARHAWVVGLSGMVWRTNDGGVSWQKQEVGSDLHLNGVAAITADEAWISAAGYGLGGWGVPDVRGTGTMFHTTDGGATWKEEQITSASNGFQFVHFVDKRNGFVVGSTCRWTGGAAADGPNFDCDHERLLATTDGGLSWHDNGELPGDSWPISMQAITDSDVVFKRYRGCPRYSDDAGVNWRWMCKAPDSMYSPALRFIDPERGWLLTWVPTSDGKQVGLSETSDGGTSWTLRRWIGDWSRGGVPAGPSFAFTSTDLVLPAEEAGIYLVSRSNDELRQAELYPLGSREVAAPAFAAPGNGADRTRYAVIVAAAAVAVAALSLAAFRRWRVRGSKF